MALSHQKKNVNNLSIHLTVRQASVRSNQTCQTCQTARPASGWRGVRNSTGKPWLGRGNASSSSISTKYSLFAAVSLLAAQHNITHSPTNHPLTLIMCQTSPSHLTRTYSTRRTRTLTIIPSLMLMLTPRSTPPRPHTLTPSRTLGPGKPARPARPAKPPIQQQQRQQDACFPGPETLRPA